MRPPADKLWDKWDVLKLSWRADVSLFLPLQEQVWWGGDGWLLSQISWVFPCNHIIYNMEVNFKIVAALEVSVVRTEGAFFFSLCIDWISWSDTDHFLIKAQEMWPQGQEAPCDCVRGRGPNWSLKVTTFSTWLLFAMSGLSSALLRYIHTAALSLYLKTPS